MSEPFLAEIRIMAFNFAPRGWAECDGQILPINSNQSLYSLLGTTYGGDGRTTFALPDLRGRVPINRSSAYPLGSKAGAETVALTQAQMPTHGHGMQATSAAATQPSAQNRVFGTPSAAIGAVYSATDTAPDTSLSSAAIGTYGLGQGHDNMQPYTTLNFCIALQGLFPSRN